MRDALPYQLIVAERISFVYIEKASLERDGHSLVAFTGSERLIIPIGRLTTLLLGPGVSASHAAMSLCALENALVMWVGEACVRLYAVGNPRGNGENLLRQCALHADDDKRLGVARAIYRLMFGEEAPQRRSIEQLRGIEGAKVKAVYASLATQNNLAWEGRKALALDPLNAAISTATSALYGIVEAVILALGYSPAIGFIHSGDARSFVFDIADTIKFSTVVPLAFRLVADGSTNVEMRVRQACRELFFQERLLAKIVEILEEVMYANGLD